MTGGARCHSRALAFLGIAVALAACASGPAPQDHFYRLEPASAPSPLAVPHIAGTLEVDRFRTDAVTGGRQLLYRRGAASSEVQRHSFHRWADSPSIMLQNELVDYLRTARVAQLIVTPELHLEADYHVGGRILRLERIVDVGSPRVTLELELSVKQQGKLLLLEIYREERQASGDDVEAAVAAWSEALSAVFERFLADLIGATSAGAKRSGIPVPEGAPATTQEHAYTSSTSYSPVP